MLRIVKRLYHIFSLYQQPGVYDSGIYFLSVLSFMMES